MACSRHWGRGTGSAKLELVFPGGTYGIRKRLVSADLIPVAEALPALLAPAAGDRMRLTGAAEAIRSNRITAGRLQLRLGRDLRWYPYTRSD